MAKQTFTTGQVLTAAQMTSLQQTAMGGGSTTAKTASYTLVAADAGTVVQMNSASATTITVNTALFAAGDSVQIQNIGAGVCTVTAGTATVNTSSTLALKQYDSGNLYFNSTSAALFFNTDAADGSSPLTTKGDLYGFSTLDARIPIGTNNQILTADSAEALGLKWATPAAASSGLVLISRQTFSGVATTTTTFDGVFSSTYNNYVISVENVSGVSGGNDFQFQLRYAGPTTQATNYVWTDVSYALGGTTQTITAGAHPQVEWQLSGDVNTAVDPLNGIYNLGLRTGACVMSGRSVSNSSGNGVDFFGYQTTARTYTGFLLKTSSTNISGTVAVYGLATS